jgi:5-methyltetrahydropteroyltriglutamate--homocysteine methyltransferase
MRQHRADQLGSLLRPQALLDARAAHERGELSTDGLREVEDREITALLDKQRSIGIDVYTDGEFRRGSWVSELQLAFAGRHEARVSRTSPLVWRGPDGEPRQVDQATPRSGPTAGNAPDRISQHEAAFLIQHAPGPFKITLPSPIQATRMLHPDDAPEDPSRQQLLRDAVALLRHEVESLIAEGVPYIQMDGPRYACYIDPNLRQRVIDAGIDVEAVLDEAIAAENACIGGPHPAEVTTAFHLCRGNGRSQWYAEGGYDAIADKLFNTLRVDTFLLEYDTERAGSFEPLRFMPRDKRVVLGLISTKGPELESQDDLLRRIEAASRYVPLEHLALSPQCGFASLLLGNLLSPEDQWRKLELVVDTAHKVWG